MIPLRDARWVDIAIKGVVLLVVIAIGFLAFTVVSARTQQQQSALTTRAIQSLIADIEAQPDNAALRVRLAEAYAAGGQIREAIEQYNAALQIRENYPDALIGLGLIAMFQEEWATAEGYWRTAADELGSGRFAGLDLRNATIYHQLGITLLQQKRYEEAAQSFHEALSVQRSASDTHYALSIAYRELGLANNQRTYLEYALMFDPVMPEANYEYGLLLLEEGDVATAAEHFRTSADNAPADRKEPNSELERLGPFSQRVDEIARLLESDPEGALVEARVARALEPEDVAVAKQVAMLYERLDDVDAAIVAWERVLELSVNDDEALAALERLDEIE